MYTELTMLLTEYRAPPRHGTTTGRRRPKRSPRGPINSSRVRVACRQTKPLVIVTTSHSLPPCKYPRVSLEVISQSGCFPSQQLHGNLAIWPDICAGPGEENNPRKIIILKNCTPHMTTVINHLILCLAMKRFIAGCRHLAFSPIDKNIASPYNYELLLNSWFTSRG